MTTLSIRNLKFCWERKVAALLRLMRGQRPVKVSLPPRVTTRTLLLFVSHEFSGHQFSVLVGLLSSTSQTHSLFWAQNHAPCWSSEKDRGRPLHSRLSSVNANSSEFAPKLHYKSFQWISNCFFKLL